MIDSGDFRGRSGVRQYWAQQGRDRVERARLQSQQRKLGRTMQIANNQMVVGGNSTLGQTMGKDRETTTKKSITTTTKIIFGFFLSSFTAFRQVILVPTYIWNTF